MASESTRWSDASTCKPIDKVDGSKKGSLVTPNIIHARKLGLLPRVTSILESLSSYVLNNWLIENAIKTCVEYPFDGDYERESDVKQYVSLIHAKSGEYREVTADRGKELHKDVELFYTDNLEPADPVALDILDHLKALMEKEKVTKVYCERSLGGRGIGFSGTPDLVCDTEDGLLIVDLKTTSLKKFKKPYFKWKLQLGAYDIMSRTTDAPQTRLLQVVADRDDGECKTIEHEHPEMYADAFMHLFEIWCIERDYDPRKWEAKK